MFTIKTYFSIEELSDMVKEKLSHEDKEKFADSLFAPIKININDNDFTIEITFISTVAQTQK